MIDAPFGAATADAYQPRGHILVTAATGALRPAALALASRGYAVTALARTAPRLDALAGQAGPLLRPLAVDSADPALGELLARAEQFAGAFTGALLYAPAVATQAWRTLGEYTAGPHTVRLLPSAWAEPPAHQPTALPRRPPRNPEGVRTLLLGWYTEENGGGTRWHTPQELSEAALELFDAPGVQTQHLGVVRPWTDRPPV
jgi:hypothetical protein